MGKWDKALYLCDFMLKEIRGEQWVYTSYYGSVSRTSRERVGFLTSPIFDGVFVPDMLVGVELSGG